MPELNDPRTRIKRLHMPPQKPEIIDRLPTGSVELTNMLDGGWVRGGINEITSDPDTGKSLITLLAIGAALERGEYAVLIDADGTFDAVWAQRFFDVTSDRFALIQNTRAEATFNLITKLVYNQTAPLVVLDSWNALVFGMDTELDLSATDNHPEIHRMRGWMFSSFLRHLNLAIGTLLFTSHKPVQIGHVAPLSGYMRHCDARVETRLSRHIPDEGGSLTTYIAARSLGGKVTRMAASAVVYEVRG